MEHSELFTEEQMSPKNFWLAEDLIVFQSTDLKPEYKKPLTVIGGFPKVMASGYPIEKVSHPDESFQTDWLQTLPPDESREPAEIRRARLIYLQEEDRARVLIDIIGSFSSRLVEFEYPYVGEDRTDLSKHQYLARQWRQGQSRPLGSDHTHLLVEVFNCMRDEFGKDAQWEHYKTRKS